MSKPLSVTGFARDTSPHKWGEVKPDAEPLTSPRLRGSEGRARPVARPGTVSAQPTERGLPPAMRNIANSSATIAKSRAWLRVMTRFQSKMRGFQLRVEHAANYRAGFGGCGQNAVLKAVA